MTDTLAVDALIEDWRAHLLGRSGIEARTPTNWKTTSAVTSTR